MHHTQHSQTPQAIIVELMEQLHGQEALLDTLYLMIDRVAVQRALHLHKENQSQAAKYLGISRTTLRKKMIILGLEPGKPGSSI